MEEEAKRIEAALQWVDKNTIDRSGICITSKQRKIYPEVTGYYIPTLLAYGRETLAISYARWLIKMQKEDGSWFDYADKNPYVFDSAQILKGLIAVRHILPDTDDHILRGCDWILTNMQDDGRLTTPCKDAWGEDESFCSELVHVYCLSPIKEAGKIFGKNGYIDAAEKIFSFYKTNYKEQILNFNLLSHFYAYVLEGLFDMGEIEMCKDAMNRTLKYQDKYGLIPGLNNVKWYCSTGLFQLALVCYKLGEKEKGDEIFYNASKFQNTSGGFYGSYVGDMKSDLDGDESNIPRYYPDEEISWAVKYYLDASKEKALNNNL